VTDPQPIRIRTQQRDGLTDVRLLLPHPMETGLRHDAAGERIPLHHITEVRVSVGARTVFVASLGFAVARDPVLAFRFRGAAPGERLRVTWTDNRGGSRSGETIL
jgi:sulfur-oxidizing protein SoxZ